MATTFRVQWQIASKIAGNQPVIVSWWATDPVGTATGIALQVEGVSVGVLATQYFDPPPTGVGPGTNLEDAATLVFSDMLGHQATVTVPAKPSWFGSDGEQLNPLDPSLAAVIAALLAAGLTDSHGRVMTGLVGGQRTTLVPAPWPDLG